MDTFDTASSTPTLSQIQGYGYVIAWTNNSPANGTALGDLLANYFDLGGKRVVVATYALSPAWLISGRITTGNYAALTASTTADVSGNLVATVPSDPVFTGITLSSVTYFHNSNFATPAVAPGAQLLATDGAGKNMIARSANGVMNINLYPGGIGGNNTEFYNLIASVILNGGTGRPTGVPALNNTGMAVLGVALLSMLAYNARKQEQLGA